MDIEQYFREVVESSQTQASLEEVKGKWDSVAELTMTDDNSGEGDGSFDCNICFDVPREPVVTLCGHLYCWPCIYRWLTRDHSTAQQCPVCRAPLSQTALVPLYGKSDEPTQKSKSKVASHSSLDIPQRPSPSQAHTFTIPSTPAQFPAPSNRHSYHHHHVHQAPQLYYDHPYYYSHHNNHYLSSPATAGGMAYALLPWLFQWLFGCPNSGLDYTNRYYMMRGGGIDSTSHRLGMQAQRSLSRISVFLLCCSILCLFLF